MSVTYDISNSQKIQNTLTVDVMPQSFKLWGQIPSYRAVGIQYNKLSIYYFHSTDTSDYWYNRNDEWIKTNINDSFAISYNVMIINEYLKFDVIYFFDEFPHDGANKLNFKLNIGIPITKYLNIEYSHISNGFGILNDANPGVDNVSIKIKLN